MHSKIWCTTTINVCTVYVVHVVFVWKHILVTLLACSTRRGYWVYMCLNVCSCFALLILVLCRYKEPKYSLTTDLEIA